MTGAARNREHDSCVECANVTTILPFRLSQGTAAGVSQRTFSKLEFGRLEAQELAEVNFGELAVTSWAIDSAQNRQP